MYYCRETEATVFLEKVAKFYRTAYHYVHEYINLQRQIIFADSKGNVHPRTDRGGPGGE